MRNAPKRLLTLQMHLNLMDVYILKNTVDSLGFLRPEDPQPEVNHNFWIHYWPVLVRRDRRWYKTGIPKGKKLTRFIRKGIPASFRSTIWLQKCPKISDEKHPVGNDVIDEIRRDLSRTFPDNSIISSQIGKNALGWILFTVAEHFPEIGYCQGFNYIAALFYIITANKNTAAQIMIHNINLRKEYYTRDMSGIRKDVIVLYRLLRDRGIFPRSLLRLMEPDFQMMVSKWFVCWYLETLPMESVLRIWDCLFNEGDSILFRIAIVLLEKSAPALLKCQGMADIMAFIHDIGSLPVAVECHELLKVSSFTRNI
uniref:Rab-GAP TBC domain-containing protein n=1 Tax=Syphacia muris TaxID=451379 RepID=A0A0N5AJE5_9BILA